ncbi:arylsulfatase [Sphingomonas sp. 28-63-12]|uniref:arylsulfatase n=1 Tax=Sphingomonas sp. 28-63-12 TaxID=1970434 RepID=UPI000BC84C21|nr:MAG: hypothetical protein B7Y47_00535 [Sphingomonas sp. 28-63-12]
MADQADDGAGKRGIDRRSLLIGGAAGAGGAAALAAGGLYIKGQLTPFIAPTAVAAGDPPKIAQSYADSHPARGERPKPPAGAPNIVAIILDDVGFADLGCYGSEIETAAIDALAAHGLRYANFRTTAMCSPTRASFLTGLNHHNAGMGWLADIDSGYPGYRGDLTRDAATLPEVLKDAGYGTYLSGKWHVNLSASNGPAGPFHNWPTNRGFDHAYWFQGHSTDYFRPGAIFDGTTLVDIAARPDAETYYVTDDLTDKAITYLRTHRAIAPDRPFFLQLAFSGAHSPLHAKPELRDRFKGRYDQGWDAVRRARLRKQRSLGIVAQTTQLPPLSKGADPWDSLSPAERQVYARYMEVYAGVIASLDENIGRLTAELESLGVRDDTLIVLFSDNGGSPEGTSSGTPNIFASALGRAVPLADAAKLLPEMGEKTTFPHYPMGWANASNTPFRLYKQFTNLGGVADPLIISWPNGIVAKGEIRQQFVHVIDLFPTLLESAKLKRPELYQGRRQKPVDGASFAATFASPAAATRREQYYELGGYRAYEEGKWRLVTLHERGGSFDRDAWALYDLSTDPTELTDLSARHPDIAASLKAKWDKAARANNVYPLDDRNLIVKMSQQRTAEIRPLWEFRPPVPYLPVDASPLVCGLDHSIEIAINRPANVTDGVLIAHGSAPAGYVIYLKGGQLFYDSSMIPWTERIAGGPVPAGKSVIRYVQKMTVRPFEGGGTLFVNGEMRAAHKFDKIIASPSYDGLSIGSDFGAPVSTAYHGANPFAGTIERVTITVDSHPPTLQEMRTFIKAMQIKV